MAGHRIRFLPGTPKASEITCLTLLQGPAGFKSGIGQHVIDAPLWSAGMQMVSSSLVQWGGWQSAEHRYSRIRGPRKPAGSVAMCQIGAEARGGGE